MGEGGPLSSTSRRRAPHTNPAARTGVCEGVRTVLMCGLYIELLHGGEIGLERSVSVCIQKRDLRRRSLCLTPNNMSNTQGQV